MAKGVTARDAGGYHWQPRHVRDGVVCPNKNPQSAMMTVHDGYVRGSDGTPKGEGHTWNANTPLCECDKPEPMQWYLERRADAADPGRGWFVAPWPETP